MKKFMAFFLALAMCGVTACGAKISDNRDVTTTTAATTAPPDDSTPTVVTTTQEAEVDVAAVEYTKYSKTIQAELGAVSGNVKAATKRDGYKGDGYVTGFKEEGDKVSVAFDIEEAQFYTIKVRVAADKEVKNTISINGVQETFTADSDTFKTLTFENNYFEKGALSVDIISQDGGIDVDWIAVVASDEIPSLDVTLKDSTLANKNADYTTQALYNYLCDNFGKNVLLGQYDTIGTTIETDAIYNLTGKSPAIRFGDMMHSTMSDSATADTDVQNAIEWYNKGGIVGYMWHWAAPIGKDEYYSDNTDFDITKAVTDEKIYSLDIGEIKALQADGKLSDECVAIVEDIDTVSAQLAKLQEAGVPVIWRPLHEASNGYFWWGEDEDAYQWLWKLMYQRMTSYHKLNNLIWVWSAQNAGWYVSDKYCDVLSVDIYDKGNYSGQINRFLFLNSISTTKPLAMSECGNFPIIDNVVREKAMWSYIGQWGGNFLLNESGTLVEEYNPLNNLINIYNNNITITRDKLPDFAKLGDELKADAEKSADDSSKSE